MISAIALNKHPWGYWTVTNIETGAACGRGRSRRKAIEEARTITAKKTVRHIGLRYKKMRATHAGLRAELTV